LARVAAVVVPIVVTVVLSLLRELMANSSAALVLVLVVVAVSVSGDRIAGVIAALVSAASFDYFLTEPYFQFAIVNRDDIETAILLTAIGLVVTEIALWGRRQQARSSRREGYLAGVANAAGMAGGGLSGDEVIETVGRMISEVLDLDECQFDPATAPVADRPRLHRDGSITWRGREVDVARDGLPTMDAIELPIGRDDVHGRYLLTSTSRVRRPDREQLLVAVTLAEQVSPPASTTDHLDIPTGGR
jgi:K+-sensing histidine kinase KdpD